MSNEKGTVATEGGYLETRLRSFAVTRFHRNPKTGEVWTEPESQRDQDLLDAADEIERLQTKTRESIEELRRNAAACREAMTRAGKGSVGLLTEAQVSEGVANHLERVLNGK